MATTQNNQKQRNRKPKISKENLSLQSILKPKNEAQYQFVRSFKEGLNIVAYGSAGVGKSFIACSLALEELFADKIEKIIIVRSAVQTRDIGFLPGSEVEKMMPFTIPFRAIVNDLCGNGTAWDILTKKGMIQFITTSFVRGLTLDNCVVIVDETQNCNLHEIDSITTRSGSNCQMIFCGDTKQTDLIKNKNDRSGFDDAIRIFKQIPQYFDLVHFTPHDIVRSPLVKSWIMAREDLGL